jgi:hypothetical protein
MKHGLTAGAAYRVANRARRNTPRLRLPLTYSQRHGADLVPPLRARTDLELETPSRVASEKLPVVTPNYDLERETILLKLVGALERDQRHGRTDDNITAIVKEWAGPLAKYVVVGGLSKPDRSRMKSAPTLRLQSTHSAVIMELRGRLPALKAALKPTGIEEVRL